MVNFDTFSILKKLGILVPAMSTKEEQKKLYEFAEECKIKFQKSLSEIGNILENDPENNKEMMEAIQKTIKEKFKLPE